MKWILAVLILVLAVCRDRLAGQSQSELNVALGRICKEYSSMRGQLDVGRLVQLDQELRRLIPYWSWEGPPARTKDYRPEYETIGVGGALFEPDLLSYSGKLLLEAHQRDPKSQRSYTLYSTVFGAQGDAGNSLPSPVAAKAYLQEFPGGPFAVQAHLALANFYADLFKVVQAEEAGESRGYKYDCFRNYLTAAPLRLQRSDAQSQAVEHYLALTRLAPTVKTFAEWLAEMRSGHGNGWHYCAD